MSNGLLYIVTTLIWGSTWLAIQYQLGSVLPIWSIVYRFILAAVLLLIYCKLTHQTLSFSFKEHKLIALQGIFLFCINYIFFYYGSIYLISGLVAVVAASIIVMNIINSKLLLKKDMVLSVVVGALTGISGVCVVFAGELADLSNVSSTKDLSMGIGLCLIATYSASLGQTISYHNQQYRQLPVLPICAFGMLYGAIFSLMVAVMMGQQPSFDFSFSYISSLIYLSVMGTVAAFGCYLTLLGRIGAERAAYIFVCLPIVSLLLSTWFEEFQWQLPIIIGLGLILLGNYLVLGRRVSA